jgi:hypothetical protein
MLGYEIFVMLMLGMALKRRQQAPNRAYRSSGIVTYEQNIIHSNIQNLEDHY